MAEANEKYDEKAESNGGSSLNLPPFKELAPEFQGDRKFAAITAPSNAASRSNSQVQNPTSLRSISRIRSNNGYGCDEEDESSEDVEAAGVVEKDPFEVHWDGGDSDPLNPRSFGNGRKWVVVVIVSMSSLCV
jgi:hypothetical protein